MIQVMSQYQERQIRLFSRALRLEYFTVGYNSLEAALSIFFGHLAGSIVLVGFGLDSVVESLSGGVLVRPGCCWDQRSALSLNSPEIEGGIE